MRIAPVIPVIPVIPVMAYMRFALVHGRESRGWSWVDEAR